MKFEDILRTMRTKEFAYRVLDKVETHAGNHFLSLYHMAGVKTIGEWGEIIEEEKRQQTTAKTVRIAYDFEYAIKQVLEELGVKTLSKTDESTDEGRCDFKVEASDGIHSFEVKTTQGTGGWTGATHSEGRGKAWNYILIQYELNNDASLGNSNLYGLFKTAHFSVTSQVNNKPVITWSGQATNTNSSTTGKIPITMFEEYRKMVSAGSVIRTNQTKKWCKIGKVDLRSHRNSLNRLWMSTNRQDRSEQQQVDVWDKMPTSFTTSVQ